MCEANLLLSQTHSQTLTLLLLKHPSSVRIMRRVNGQNRTQRFTTAPCAFGNVAIVSRETENAPIKEGIDGPLEL